MKMTILNEAKIIAKIGAWLCVLLGVLYSIVTWLLLFPRSYVSDWQAGVLILYTLLAFVPFIVFVYPGLKMPRKPIFWSILALEALLLGLFLCTIFTD